MVFYWGIGRVGDKRTSGCSPCYKAWKNEMIFVKYSSILSLICCISYVFVKKTVNSLNENKIYFSFVLVMKMERLYMVSFSRLILCQGERMLSFPPVSDFVTFTITTTTTTPAGV